jgi:alanine racemase
MTLAARAVTRAPSVPTLAVDPAAITANVRTIAARTGGEIMAVVKADGFGHGLRPVARAALEGGATRFGVTSLAEAVAVREAGLSQPVLSWLNPVDADLAPAAEHDVELAVPSSAHLRAVVATAPGTRVHLHLDTGLARDGAEPSAWPGLCREARRAERAGLLRVVGLMGHLPCAATPGHQANAIGRTRFEWAVQIARAAGLRPRHRHLAATAATLTDPRSHHTMSRIGAGLVGIDETGTTALRPALTLTAPLVAVRMVHAGTSVGYGHTWTAPRTTRLGLLPLGYADGLPRRASNRAEVLVAGVRRPVVGRISMDMTVVDLGPDAGACPADLGDSVTVFGPGADGEPTTAEWATWSDALEHEIVTGLGPRVARSAAGRRLRSVR